jgi:hypothetical protein
MRVRRTVDMCASPNRPESHGNERPPDKTFTPDRNRLDRRKEIAEQNGEQGDDDNS